MLMMKDFDDNVRRRELLQVGVLASMATGASFAAGSAMSQPPEADTPVVAHVPTVRDVRDYGAVGDGQTADTHAVQEAINAGGITFFPPGTYRVSNLIAVDGMRLLGTGTAGSGQARLRTTTGNIFRTTENGVHSTKMTGLVFDSFGGGDHLFTGLWSLGMFEDCAFTQYQNEASCFSVKGWIDMLTLRCTFDHTYEATVPTFSATSATGELAQSTFISNRFTKTGDYAIHLEGTEGSVVENFSIRDTNFEQPMGGAIRLLSARNTSIQNPGMWDFPKDGAAKHLIYVGASPSGGAASSNNEITHYVRDASSGPRPDVYDIKVEANTEFTSVLNARHQLSGSVLLDLGGSTGLVIGDNAVVSNGSLATVISSRTVKFPHTSKLDRPAAQAAGAGTQTYDSDLQAFIYSDGLSWRKLEDGTLA